MDDDDLKGLGDDNLDWLDGSLTKDLIDASEALHAAANWYLDQARQLLHWIAQLGRQVKHGD
jgi:hypothetical protein